MEYLRPVSLFILAGVCEISGGWLMWKWLRDSKPTRWGIAGALILVMDAVIPTLQTSHFGRIYGGDFIAHSLLWAGGGNRPDWPDVLGG